MNSLLLAIVLPIALLVLLELGLRTFFGFGNPLTYVADAEIGYLLTPNQQVRRFGNRIVINQYSMRSAAITAERSPKTMRILIVGDSVANGGWWTDQKDIISTLLQHQLQQCEGVAQSGDQLEVLNASANSWGPRNELAYLQKFGIFSAQIVILILNTDDLFSVAPTSLVVGRDWNYPDRKPWLALQEIISRYLVRPQASPELSQALAEKGDRVGANLKAIQSICELVEQHQSKLLVAMTPLLREVVEPGKRDYELRARQRLGELAKSQGFDYIDLLATFQAATTPTALYRDHIHLSPQGNQLMSQSLDQALTSYIPQLTRE